MSQIAEVFRIEESPYRPVKRQSALRAGKKVVYPDSDGKPMADNTKQFNWIVRIKEGLEALFADRPDIFVAGDLLWYPVEGNNKIRVAPDAMVVFGRPKGDRGSYRQWEENDIAPQVVFEVLSPGNTAGEMARKLIFYDQYGVEEYYQYDPDKIGLKAWIRKDDHLQPVADVQGWKSPMLGIYFRITDNDMSIFRPDGQKFLSPLEMEIRTRQEIFRADIAEAKAKDAELKVKDAEAKARKALEDAEKERLRAEILEAKLKALEQLGFREKG